MSSSQKASATKRRTSASCLPLDTTSIRTITISRTRDTTAITIDGSTHSLAPMVRHRFGRRLMPQQDRHYLQLRWAASSTQERRVTIQLLINTHRFSLTRCKSQLRRITPKVVTMSTIIMGSRLIKIIRGLYHLSSHHHHPHPCSRSRVDGLLQTTLLALASVADQLNLIGNPKSRLVQAMTAPSHQHGHPSLQAQTRRPIPVSQNLQPLVCKVTERSGTKQCTGHRRKMSFHLISLCTLEAIRWPQQVMRQKIMLRKRKEITMTGERTSGVHLQINTLRTMQTTRMSSKPQPIKEIRRSDLSSTIHLLQLQKRETQGGLKPRQAEATTK